MQPEQQVSEPVETAEVWVIVYDGFWRSCPNAFDQNGNLIPYDRTRWLVVAEAAREGTGFIYLQDWSGEGVPDLLPLPRRQGRRSGSPLAFEGGSLSPLRSCGRQRSGLTSAGVQFS